MSANDRVFKSMSPSVTQAAIRLLSKSGSSKLIFWATGFSVLYETHNYGIQFILIFKNDGVTRPKNREEASDTNERARKIFYVQNTTIIHTGLDSMRGMALNYLPFKSHLANVLLRMSEYNRYSKTIERHWLW